MITPQTWTRLRGPRMNIQSLTVFFSLAAWLSFGAEPMRAQVAPSAYKNQLSVTGGGMFSHYYPDYVSVPMFGVGLFVDVNVAHGLGVEAEGRWQRTRNYQDISENNFLIGPRMEFKQLLIFRPYAKVLGGVTEMNFDEGLSTGVFGTIAAGGGIDVRLTNRLNIRAIDAEYQYLPKFLDSSLTPYGVSAGISYRFF